MKIQVMTKAIAFTTILTLSLPNLAAIAQSGPGRYGNVNTVYSCSRDGDPINLRARAGQQYRVITKIPPGRAVVLTGDSRVVYEFTWQKVNFYGAVGWVRGDFLCN